MSVLRFLLVVGGVVALFVVGGILARFGLLPGDLPFDLDGD